MAFFNTEKDVVFVVFLDIVMYDIEMEKLTDGYNLETARCLKSHIIS